ncbi:BQ2448_1384 [Microbotryum intermedium]|uniref:BQ2448_1384 protein n=1 Tax=Microbotryum intermedium TaxID=269621 RepID=A0A238F816_9BASI|nr:BQ2448_1384 [Microbotryum intermedium]
MSSTVPPQPVDSSEAIDTLAAIFPQLPQSTLQRSFVASSRNLERETTALLGHDDNVKHDSLRAVKRKRIERLDHWLKPASSSLLPQPVQSRVAAPPSPSLEREVKTAPSSTFDAFQLLHRKSISKTPAPCPMLTTAVSLAVSARTTIETGAPATRLPPLTLSTPEAIAKHTRGRIMLIPNVLPRELANMLFQSMLDEDEGRAQDGSKEPCQSSEKAAGLARQFNPVADLSSNAGERNKWYMFDREVESPHTTSFYVDKALSVGREGHAESTNVALTTHWYNGTKRQGRFFTPLMDQARSLIQPLANSILGSPANCYRGAEEGVGAHSDVLTCLGPFPTIASLSLGCTRPFRLRPFMPLPDIKMRTLDLVLPHKSLCLMLPGTQEFYKHSVQPVSALDTFKISGQEERYRGRISITFRHYRPDYAPLPDQASISLLAGSYAGTPHCHCKFPTILRPDGKGRARAHLKKDKPKEDSGVKEGEEGDDMIFFWTCSASRIVPGQNCGFWKLLSEQQAGRGPWFRGRNAA